jgi:hypothetical protein
MCLHPKPGETLVQKIAEKDIKVYKLMVSIMPRYSTKNYRQFQTGYLNKQVSHEEITGAVTYKGVYSRYHVDHPPVDLKKISDGYVHTFRDIEDAIKALNGWHGRDWYYPVVMEATIPKGTAYYEGYMVVDSQGECYTYTYASKCIRFGQVLKCKVDGRIYDYSEYQPIEEKIMKQMRGKNKLEKDPFE